MLSSTLRSARQAILTLLPLGCGLLLACSPPSGPLTPEPGDPPIGTKIDAKSLLDFYPQFLAGMKYVYVSVEKKGEVDKSTRVEAEVLEANADQAKLRLTIGGTQSSVIDVNRASPPGLPPGGIVFEAREQISVPAGNFSAQKFSYSQNNSTFNAWARRGTGILKVLEQRPNGDTVTTTLQSFSK